MSNQARYSTAVRLLYTQHDVTVTPLAPVDTGDRCEACARHDAMVQDSELGHRFCDAQCALDYFDRRTS